MCIKYMSYNMKVKVLTDPIQVRIFKRTNGTTHLRASDIEKYYIKPT